MVPPRLKTDTKCHFGREIAQSVTPPPENLRFTQRRYTRGMSQMSNRRKNLSVKADEPAERQQFGIGNAHHDFSGQRSESGVLDRRLVYRSEERRVGEGC